MPAEPKTALGRELYALMKEPAGATAAAIREKPGLMGLRFVRAETPARHDHDAYEQAVAVMVCEHLEAASRTLNEVVTQRQSPLADNGAAARCLLGIEKGTDTMLLYERREKAAKHADKERRSMIKSHGKTPDYEMRLMDALAGKLEAREVAELDKEPPSPFDRSFVDRFLPSWTPRPLADYYRAWSIAKRLGDGLNDALGCVQRKSADQHRGYRCGLCFPPLMNYARLTAVTTAIGEPDRWAMFRKDDFPARNALRRIQTASPFDQATHTLLEQSVVTEMGYPQLDRAFGKDVSAQWDGWVRTCECADTPGPSCRVHQTISGSTDYVTTVEIEWQRLQEGLHALTPSEFVTATEPLIYGSVGLRVPSAE
jgi:hypothetical protein